jgi:DNA uptake protein ComE-like DNA-binding protein
VRTRAAITLLLVAGFGLGRMNHPPAASAQNPRPQHAPPTAQMQVDINRATLEDLLKVPGMTPTWAGRIVRFRPYRSKRDLLDRGVVSGEVYNRIKDHVIAHREKQ